jgi:tetratricopeptide (TPR) repeat protein
VTDAGHAGIDRGVGRRIHVHGSGAVGDRVSVKAGYAAAGRDVHLHLAGEPSEPDLYQYQLPPDIGDFTGRDTDISRLRRLLERAARPEETSAVVSAIAGKPGVGKTALATKVAHQVSDQFPDGQLYVDLRGAAPDRLDPFDALGDILLSLGVARAAIDDNFGQRQRQYRALLAPQRMLVLLDNAGSASQVRPLLPSGPSCAALITSRRPLTSLGAEVLRLDVLSPDDAVDLLGKIAGKERIAAQASQAYRIARLCGYLPLAIRIAGAKLAARPHWPLARLADRLSDERDRLAVLNADDLGVRASVALSYEGLDADQRRIFRLLGLLKPSDFPAWVAAALLDEDLDIGEELVEQLVEAQVLEVAREALDASAGQPQEPGGDLQGTRYRFHDLLRAFARERLEEDASWDRQAALERALNAYLVLARRAAAQLDPARRIADPPTEPERLGYRFRVPDRLLADPGQWLTVERVSLIAALEQAYERGLWELTWKLAAALAYFFDLRNHWTDWQHTQEVALEATRQAANRSAEAQGLRSLGRAHLRQNHLKEAIDHFNKSLLIFEEVGDQRGEARTLNDLADAHVEQSHFEEAIQCLDRCRAIFERLGDRGGQAWTTFSVGTIHRIQGRYVAALDCFQQVRQEMRKLDDRRGEAYALINCGIVCRQRDFLDTALCYFAMSLPIFQKVGDGDGQAWYLVNIGHVFRKRGRLEDALRVHTDALTYFRRVGDRRGQAWVLLNIGHVSRAQAWARLEAGHVSGAGKHLEDAMASLNESLSAFYELGDQRGQAWAFVSLGEVHRLCGEPEDALVNLGRALPVLRRVRERLWEAKALSIRGHVLAEQGELGDAARDWHEALKILTEIGLDARAKRVQEWLEERTPAEGPA